MHYLNLFIFSSIGKNTQDRNQDEEKGLCFGDGFHKNIHERFIRSNSAVAANSELSTLINKLWKLDTNRLRFGNDFRLSYQSKGGSYDKSWNPLIEVFNNGVFQKPTYKAFLNLLNNYETTTGIAETTTQQEANENFTFLNAVLDTAVMREVFYYLRRKGKTLSSYKKFKHELYTLWFENYYRSSSKKIRDSSGFEHVFVGELKGHKREVTGFHNWIQFYLEEKKQNLNYFGYMKKTSSPYVLVTKFLWHNQFKHFGSLFIGTSPEFELSLYTLVYMLGYEKLQFTLDGIHMQVTCFGINGNRSIGTCYPDLI